MQFEHQWVNKGLVDEEMEAVLVAQNTPYAWEPGQIIRAFQTHQWSNASTDNDRVCFAHDETGTIVCHDESVVAIECGHGNLVDALPDLILVLSDLGWKGVYVYCLAAHMNGVMTDIGRSIPAHLDFEVQEALRGTPISDMPESQVLLDHGREMLQISGATAGGTGAIFNSLGADMNTQAYPQTPIEILEDDGIEDSDDVPIATTITTTATTNANINQSESEDDGDPRVFGFLQAETVEIADTREETSPPSGFVENTQDISNSEDTPAIDEYGNIDLVSNLKTELFEAQEALRSSQELVDELKHKADENYNTLQKKESDMTELMTELQNMKSASDNKQVSVVAETSVGDNKFNLVDAIGFPNQYGGLVPVGNSAFYFGENGRIDAETVMSIARCFKTPLETDQIIHLWPGEMRPSVRWNVLNEIDLEMPLFANTFTQWAFPDTDTPRCGEIILENIDKKQIVSLRNLHDDYGTAFGRNLIALSLTKKADSFVDIPSTEDNSSEDIIDSFTVREVLLSPTSKLFVVHIDSLDGPFVHWLVELLYKISTGYGSSDRYKKLLLAMELKTEPADDTPQTQDIKNEVTVMIEDLMHRLHEMGVLKP